MSKEKVLAYIPARGGSSRIPNKNIKDFLGKPLVAYTIEQALALSFVDRVIVDTDSPKIAAIAKKYGAEVPWLRPAYLAQDHSQAIDSILYTVKKLIKEQQYKSDYVLILQTTSPLRELEDIKKCWRLMRQSNADSVLTVCPTHPRLYNLSRENDLLLVNRPKKQSDNVQDWPAGFILNGCFVYLVKTEALLKEKTDITKKTKAVVCPKWRSIDLDIPEDWFLAELIYKNKKNLAQKIKKFK
ncbi:MAG: acylneuraminate cytidylyltransferase family protein [bacterium]|nr:acylneuraminate cytidylyltransferase family protein [bacterium]